MGNVRRIVCIMLCIMAIAIPALAQEAQATLVGRAVIPADTQANGPKSLLALAPKKVINGIKVPFNGQPVGNISAIEPTDYPNAWLLMVGGPFDPQVNPGDYVLRIYTAELDLLNAKSGGGTADIVDIRTLSDPKKLTNTKSSTRELTGADFDPRAFYQAKDGSFWVAVANGPSLLYFDPNGYLLQPPISLGGAADLQSMSAAPNGSSLLIAQRSASGSSTVVLRSFDLKRRRLDNKEVGSYNLDDAANSISSLLTTNGQQAIVIEQDNKQNKDAKVKKIYLADFTAKPARKTLLVDLLNITDPDKLSTNSTIPLPPNPFGLGQIFKFPYSDVSGVYPIDARTLLIVNNNRVPVGLGRSTTQADDTDFAAIQLAQPLDLDPALHLGG